MKINKRMFLIIMAIFLCGSHGHAQTFGYLNEDFKPTENPFIEERIIIFPAPRMVCDKDGHYIKDTIVYTAYLARHLLFDSIKRSYKVKDIIDYDEYSAYLIHLVDSSGTFSFTVVSIKKNDLFDYPETIEIGKYYDFTLYAYYDQPDPDRINVTLVGDSRHFLTIDDTFVYIPFGLPAYNISTTPNLRGVCYVSMP
jgi:hypothetical protein